jgi:hypothetical protein
MEGTGRGVILRYYLDSRLQNHEKHVRIASLRAEIWTQDLPNTKQECLLFVLLTKYYYYDDDDQIKKDEKGGLRSANGRYKEYTQHFSRKTVKEETNLKTYVWLQSRRPEFDPRQGKRIFPLASVSRPVLGLTQPPVQGVPGIHTQGVKRGRGVTLITHPLLWRGQE